MTELDAIRAAMEEALAEARGISGGEPATYIPELANAPLEHTGVAVAHVSGETLYVGDDPAHELTVQSSGKLIVLLGLLEERGPEFVFEVVGSEPSGSSFSSLARLDEKGPRASNPFVNAGAISLCGQLEGPIESRLAWLESWAAKLYGAPLEINQRVMFSERRTGDRNRAIAYLLKSNGVFPGDVDEVLETYFALCSFETTVAAAATVPRILACGGRDGDGKQIVSPETAGCAVSLMATCGMYDESGEYLRHTGLPAKSGVSGIIVAVAPRRAGIAVFNPRVNAKGGSVRGHHMLRTLSSKLGWHLAR